MKKKRDIFGEIMEGIESMGKHREGKITLRTHEIEKKSAVNARFVRATRERLNMSVTAFAHQLRISPRTLEKWEQGQSKPNSQAAALIMMVRKYPDTIERLANLQT